MKKFMQAVLLVGVLMAPMLARAAEQVEQAAQGEPGAEQAAWEAAADKRYAELDLEAAESKAYFQQKMRELNLQKAQHQAKESATFQERKHALELREREAALTQPKASAAGANRSCSKKDGCGLLLVAVLIVHLLLAIWVYQDIRRRNAGSGIWIVIALITGLLGAFVYALVRIGDNRAPPAG